MEYYLEMNPLMDLEGAFMNVCDAMEYADKYAAYNGCDMVVYDENHNEVCKRRWYGVEFDPTESDESEREVIRFGTFGYYDWWRNPYGEKYYPFEIEIKKHEQKRC